MQVTRYRIGGVKRIAIIGAGEFGKQAAHYILQNDRQTHKYEIAGWYDDTITKGRIINGFRILGAIDDVMGDYNSGNFEYLFIAIGYNHLKFKNSLIERFKDKIPLYNIISPTSYVNPSASIGINIFIYPNAIIDKDVKLEDGVTVNLGSIVSHNSSVGAGSFIAPGVTIAGFSTIGSGSFIGVGSVIKDDITICENTTIGAGSVVVKDIVHSGTYIGVPAMPLNK